LLTVP